ncbi:hypothetical protein ACFFV7_48425 [Nonomuraea spiralis]|uniref:Uncharacterized protein n=1 Tax=Nonomuraea spiralis TaxID=46182 RepID=A0ABV5IZB0_9ACTN|nr:hypothetical protein [Nonomuraea spiralis]GGT21973.1 hypothetical protein GCM10010176_078120 [Nonomuraea spiralis]
MGEDQEGAEPGVESVNCHEGLVRLLAEQFARADVSLRELQARADRAGGPRLPRATCADMLAGRRFPKKAVMVTFLRACGVPEHRVPEWERAWERVRLARMPPTNYQLAQTVLSTINHPPDAFTPSAGALPRPGITPLEGPTRASTTPLEDFTPGAASLWDLTRPAAVPLGGLPGAAPLEDLGQGTAPPEGVSLPAGGVPPERSDPPADPQMAGSGTHPLGRPPADDVLPIGGLPVGVVVAAAPMTGGFPVTAPTLGGELAVPGGGGAGLREWGRRRAAGTAALVVAGAVGVGVAVGWWAAPRQADPVTQGRSVSDDGRAFGPGGSSRFAVTVDPANTGVRLIRRLDAGIAMQQAAITVNGSPAGSWHPLPVENTYRWRDQTVDLPPALTTGRRSLTVVNSFVSSSLDFNEFLYVVKQQVKGVWSIADTVDVGPYHTTSEAAHDYRLTGPQTFADTRHFAYAPLDGTT